MIKLSEQVATLEAEIDEAKKEISLLKARLVAQELVATIPWDEKLTPSQNSLMQILAARPHHIFSRYEIDSAIPGYDHVIERDNHVIFTHVSLIRNILGDDAIETVRGYGYRLGKKYAQRT